MKGQTWSTLFLLSILCGGCISPKVVTVWQPDDTEPHAYNQILVAAITRERNDNARRATLENQAVNYFSDKGIDAVSSLDLFGPEGLRLFAEEAAYVALCKKNIDAVLTIAEVNASQSVVGEKNFGKRSSSVFYYNHIWNYRNRYEDSQPGSMPGTPDFLWECILFDLNSLQPRAVLVVKSIKGEDYKATEDRIVREIISKMIKEKIIKAKVKQEPRKAF